MKDIILSLSNLSFCNEILLPGNKKWAHDFYKGFWGAGGWNPSNLPYFKEKRLNSPYLDPRFLQVIST
jgi:hypothetical protein